MKSSLTGGETDQRAADHRRGVGLPTYLDTIVQRSASTLSISFRESGIVLFTFLAVIGFSLASPQFLTLDSLRSILNNAAIIAVVAAGMTAVVVARQIDLSIGAILGITAYATAAFQAQGMPSGSTLAAAILVGTLLGCFNGATITLLRVPAIIATLATASVFRGVLFLVAKGTLGYEIHASQLPASFRGLSGNTVLGIPILVVVALVTALVLGVILAYAPWGRNLYAIGSNPDGARYAGIRSDPLIVGALTLVGAMGGLGGFLYAMRFATVNVRTGSGFEFSVIAAVVVGGVAIFGGSGRVFGAVLGALLLSTLSRGFVLMYIPEFWKDVATGLAIVGAVLTDTLLKRRQEERLRQALRPHLAGSSTSRNDNA